MCCQKEAFISELAVTILAHCGFVRKPHCAVFNSVLNTIRNRAAVGEKRSQKKTAYHAAFKAFFVHKKFTIFFLRKVPPQLAKSSPPISEKFPPCVLIIMIF